MAFTTKLELRQSHSLVMTPQLQQAIKLLQLSNMELAAFVETELERNPLLEREEADETGSPLAADAPEAAANLFEAAAKEEMNGHAVDGAEVSDADASGSDEGEWLDLQADDQWRARRRSRYRASGRASRRRRLQRRHAEGDELDFPQPGSAHRRRRGAQSRSLCRGRADAEGPSVRPARACLHRPGDAADRPSSHRHDR